MKRLSILQVFDNIHLSNIKPGQKMANNLDGHEQKNRLAIWLPNDMSSLLSSAISEHGKYEDDALISEHSIKAEQYINAATPSNTKRAYIGDVQYFMQWQIAAFGNISWPVTEDIAIQFIFHHLQEMPIDIESKLLAGGWKKRSGSHSINTVRRRLVSISIWHTMNGKADPSESHKVKALLSAMAKTKEGPKRTKAITANILEQMLATCKGSAIDIRDRALLLFGWCSGGRRRSEISDAIFKNLEELADGNFIYHIERSKTDQQGVGHDVPVKGKAAMALREWLKFSKISNGNLFTSVSKNGKIGKKITDVDINRVVKKRIALAGYDPVQYSAHSLRRGFVSEAGKQGCPLGDVMAMTGHKSVNIAMRYYESGAVINNKAANLLVS